VSRLPCLWLEKWPSWVRPVVYGARSEGRVLSRSCPGGND